MSSREQGDAVAVSYASGETSVQDSCTFDLLGVSHATGQSLGVAARQAVIQVVFHGFFSDGEAQSDGFVGVSSCEGFLSVVISDGSAFVLDRGCGEARQLNLFFKATLRSLGLVDFLVLFAVLSVLQTKQGVQAGKKFFQQLCA